MICPYQVIKTLYSIDFYVILAALLFNNSPLSSANYLITFMAKVLYPVLRTLVVVIFMFCSCKKFEKQGRMPVPGIALTFDDNRVDNWYTYLPVFDSAGAKVTFYVSNYNKLKDEQKRKLSILQSHGHEIAFHSTNHYNMEEYLYKQKHTIEELMRCEVEAGLKLMNNDGFYPTTFAYPYGAHNGLLDKTLMRYFKSVRALNGTQDYTKSVVPTDKNHILYGLGIDKSSKRSDGDVLTVIKSAKENNTCAVFVAHDINTSSKFSVTLDRLKDIFRYVKQNNLQYYKISEISD
jgi:peptidoglycan/xylan/chitin deacetylase (PgdA/CDA1 family)